MKTSGICLIQTRFNRGLTLIEMLISAALTTVIFAGLLAGMVSLQKSFQATSYYSGAVADQSRALDYIVRDTRGGVDGASLGGRKDADAYVA